MNKFSFHLYLLFTASWFLHLGTRVPIVGALRIDLILIFIISILILFTNHNINTVQLNTNNTNNSLICLFTYIVLTIPFVEWPGSVVNTGLREFTKAIVFYFFTVHLVNSEKRLKIFLTVFLLCQSFRVIEPLYLHITVGYWGDIASMAGGEFMDRLAGSPHDTINPNGLAFVIVSILPYFIYLGFSSWKISLLSLPLVVSIIYALILTGSRSGFISLVIIGIGIFLKSRHRVLLGGVYIVAAIFILSNLNFEQRDRYLSIVDSRTANAATSQGRIQGIIDDFEVALRRPLFGHGLGTSLEANGNFGSHYHISHNLYSEVSQELGFIGLAIYTWFLATIVTAIFKNNAYSNCLSPYLYKVTKSMQVWILMSLFFSLTSYGLSTYSWYLFGGLSATVNRIAHANELQQSGIYDQ